MLCDIAEFPPGSLNACTPIHLKNRRHRLNHGWIVIDEANVFKKMEAFQLKFITLPSAPSVRRGGQTSMCRLNMVFRLAMDFDIGPERCC